MRGFQPRTKRTRLNPRNGEINFLAPKYKKLDDKDKYLALKEKIRLKNAEKAFKKSNEGKT